MTIRVRQTLFASISLLVFACSNGGDESDLVGDWGVLNASSCVVYWSFDDSDERGYSSGQICALENGDLGLEFTYGLYHADDGELTLTANQSTCPMAAVATSLSYDIVDGMLEITSPSGTTRLEKKVLPDPAHSGATRQGCYSEGGAFAPHAISSIAR